MLKVHGYVTRGHVMDRVQVGYWWNFKRILVGEKLTQCWPCIILFLELPLLSFLEQMFF